MSAKRVIYPSCSVCHGKGIINIDGMVEIKCPACHFSTWRADKDVTLLLTELDARNIRLGKVQRNSPSKGFWQKKWMVPLKKRVVEKDVK